MDPLSITVSCITLIGAIATTSKTITSFIREVRDARNDLDLVSRELLSLETVLSLLADDVKTSAQGLPSTLERQILGIIANCDRVVAEIETSLTKHGKSKLGRGGRWTVGGGKDDMARLRLTLEAHKSALEIALDMVTISIAKDIKKDTEDIKDDTAAIRDDTGQILAEIARLQARLPGDHKKEFTPNFILQEYLDDLTSYAESGFEMSVEDRPKSIVSGTAAEAIPEDTCPAVVQEFSNEARNLVGDDNAYLSVLEAIQRHSDLASPAVTESLRSTRLYTSQRAKQVHFDSMYGWDLSAESGHEDGSFSAGSEEAFRFVEQALAHDDLAQSRLVYSKEAIVRIAIQLTLAMLIFGANDTYHLGPGSNHRLALVLDLPEVLARVKDWQEECPLNVAEFSQLLIEGDAGCRRHLLTTVQAAEKIYHAPIQTGEKARQHRLRELRRKRDALHEIGGGSIDTYDTIIHMIMDMSCNEGTESMRKQGVQRKARRTSYEVAEKQKRDKRGSAQGMPSGYTQLSARKSPPGCAVM